MQLAGNYNGRVQRTLRMLDSAYCTWRKLQIPEGQPYVSKQNVRIKLIPYVVRGELHFYYYFFNLG